MERVNKPRYPSAMHAKGWFGALCALRLLGACATASSEVAASKHALGSGDVEAPPSYAALPEIDQRQRTPRVLQGLSVARQVLAQRLPEPPDDRRHSTLSAWIGDTVIPWIDKRREGAEEVRFQFGLTSSGEFAADSGEATIARGLLGLVDEDTAEELMRIPLPSELDTEPEIAGIFHELVDTQAKPFRNAALNEYQRCDELARARIGQGDRSGVQWEEFCRARFARLRSSTAGVSASLATTSQRTVP